MCLCAVCVCVLRVCCIPCREELVDGIASTNSQISICRCPHALRRSNHMQYWVSIRASRHGFIHDHEKRKDKCSLLLCSLASRIQFRPAVNRSSHRYKGACLRPPRINTTFRPYRNGLTWPPSHGGLAPASYLAWRPPASPSPPPSPQSAPAGTPLLLLPSASGLRWCWP